MLEQSGGGELLLTIHEVGFEVQDRYIICYPNALSCSDGGSGHTPQLG